MKESLYREMFMILNNTVRIAIFGMLAYLFSHWWIVLISMFFLVYEKDDKE